MENFNGYYETKDKVARFNENNIEHKNECGKLMFTEHIKTAVYQPEQVLVEYNVKQKIFLEIQDYKNKLSNTDYKAIQFSEGEISAEEYAPLKQQRKFWRAEINRLEVAIKSFV